MQPRFGQVPPSRSGSIMATLSPASRVATVTHMPALPPPRITTSKLRVGIPPCSLRLVRQDGPGQASKNTDFPRHHRDPTFRSAYLPTFQYARVSQETSIYL